MQSRPFGVALLLAGWDSDGPTLYVSFKHASHIMPATLHPFMQHVRDTAVHLCACPSSELVCARLRLQKRTERGAVYVQRLVFQMVQASLRCIDVCRFHTDPSGTFVTYEAKAIGSGSEGAQTSLQVSAQMYLLSASAQFSECC